jgi:hypothetical protein
MKPKFKEIDLAEFDQAVVLNLAVDEYKPNKFRATVDDTQVMSLGEFKHHAETEYTGLPGVGAVYVFSHFLTYDTPPITFTVLTQS